jgi:hypothetical protein
MASLDYLSRYRSAYMQWHNAYIELRKIYPKINTGIRNKKPYTLTDDEVKLNSQVSKLWDRFLEIARDSD